MIKVFAIDPGSSKSGWVLMDSNGDVLQSGVESNPDLLVRLAGLASLDCHVVIEEIVIWRKSLRTIAEVVRWSGRFEQAVTQHNPVFYINRKAVLGQLGLRASQGDRDARGRLIEIYGPSPAIAMGDKANPGPLFRVRGKGGHMWQALALGVAHLRRRRLAELKGEEGGSKDRRKSLCSSRRGRGRCQYQRPQTDARRGLSGATLHKRISPV